MELIEAFGNYLGAGASQVNIQNPAARLNNDLGNQAIAKTEASENPRTTHLLPRNKKDFLDDIDWSQIAVTHEVTVTSEPADLTPSTITDASGKNRLCTHEPGEPNAEGYFQCICGKVNGSTFKTHGPIRTVENPYPACKYSTPGRIEPRDLIPRGDTDEFNFHRHL
jgi:hypothetical protein